MTRLWLVRHGPTHARTLAGWSDIPADLSDHGALARLGARLPQAAVVSSDLTRAVATADALAGSRPRLPHAPALREMHFGAWEGLTHAEVAARDPDLSRAFWTDPEKVAPPGGEGWQALRARVTGAVAELAPGRDDLIVVAHFGVILALIQQATGEGITRVMGRRIEPLSLSTITLGPGGWGLGAVNQAP
ncbi:MAG: histidine phosphatase family protein [Rubellimicrobium sp.]|nr:histidine phosphatase family protein [Rubellimicrobium sp.]